jgi:alkylhydroperoxidase family enzyme
VRPVGLSGGAGLRKGPPPLEEQRKRYGAPLYPYLFYARNAAYFCAAQAMWTALQQATTRGARYTQSAAQPSGCFVERLPVLNGLQCCRGSRFGVPTEKIDALDDYAKSPLFTEAEKVALEYADAITDMVRDVDDELFARLQRHYDDDTIAELTMIIAWENASSRFNRAFRIPSQGFWKR